MKTNSRERADRLGPATSFRLFLQQELARRCARNPHYSLRAFARYLGTDHATLSQLLRGKRRLTSRTLSRFGRRLGLDRSAITAYAFHEERAAAMSAIPPNLDEVQQLARDAASLLSDWSHLGILELIHLEEFKPDTRWIARVLGLTPDEVNVAVTRLVRLGLLKMAARDRWIDKSGNAAAGLAEFAQVAVQRLSEQVRTLLGRRGILETSHSGGSAWLIDQSHQMYPPAPPRSPVTMPAITSLRRMFGKASVTANYI